MNRDHATISPADAAAFWTETGDKYWFSNDAAFDAAETGH
jgi:uncharacterized protein (DUF924 family)